MKILLVIDNLGSGGAQRQITILAKWLKRDGYDVHFFHYYPQDFFLHELSSLGIPIHFVHKKNKLGIEVIAGLSKILKREKFDIILSFLSTPNLYAVLAKQLARSKSENITSERSKTNFGVNNVRLFFKKWTHKKSGWVVFNSYHERNNWGQHVPAIKNRLKTIYNGIDLNIFSPRHCDYKRSHNLLCIGRVEPGKNGLYIIEALNMLIKKGITISVTWLGHVTLSDNERKDYYDRMCSKLKEYDLGQYWIWQSPSPDVKEIIHSHDALLHPSTIEGLPNVICESLACGVPVFAANLLDHPLLIEDGKRGYLFDAANPGSLVNALTGFYNLNDEEYRRLCANARAYAERELSIEKMVSSYEELFIRARVILN